MLLKLRKINKAAVVAVMLIICMLAAGCSSTKSAGNVKRGLQNAVKDDNFKNVQVNITYSFQVIPKNEDEKLQEEREDHSDLAIGTVTKYGNLYYQTDESRDVYYSTEDGTEYIYYRYNDGTLGDKSFSKYYAEDFEGNSQLAKKVNFEFFSSITDDMFEKYDDESGSCFATDKYEKAIIQTIFPNNSFDKLSDISLEFKIDDDLISEIIYKYTFDKSTKFVMNYEFEYNDKKVELPKKYSDLT